MNLETHEATPTLQAGLTSFLPDASERCREQMCGPSEGGAQLKGGEAGESGPKPAASLSTSLIRRGAVRDDVLAALKLSCPEATPLSGVNGRAAEAGGYRPHWHGSLRGAGLFGVLYLAALMLFATALHMWPN